MKKILCSHTLIAKHACNQEILCTRLLPKEGESVWKFYYAVILCGHILLHYVLTMSCFCGPQFVFKYQTTLHIPHRHQLLTCVVCGHAFGLVVLVYSANTVPPLINILQLSPHSSSHSG